MTKNREKLSSMQRVKKALQFQKKITEDDFFTFCYCLKNQIRLDISCESSVNRLFPKGGGATLIFSYIHRPGGLKCNMFWGFQKK